MPHVQLAASSIDQISAWHLELSIGDADVEGILWVCCCLPLGDVDRLRGSFQTYGCSSCFMAVSSGTVWQWNMLRPCLTFIQPCCPRSCASIALDDWTGDLLACSWSSE